MSTPRGVDTSIVIKENGEISDTIKYYDLDKNSYVVIASGGETPEELELSLFYQASSFIELFNEFI